MAEAFDTREPVEAAERDDEFFPINKLPVELIVSVFIALEDPDWVRSTVPLVCKEWNGIYRSKDASPLHETLEVDFGKEVDRAAAAAAAREGGGRRDPITGDPLPPVLHASRVIKWAQERAGSVLKLRLKGLSYERLREHPEALKDFTAEDLGTLVAVVGPSLTEISIGQNLGELCKGPLWDSLRGSVVPAGRLRSLVVEGIRSVLNESDLEPLGRLAGSLEELVLETRYPPEHRGLTCFPESFCALTELRRLVLVGHPQITAIPAGISSLKKLEELSLNCCSLSSLPKELGELSGLTTLVLSSNSDHRITLPADEAFPAELGKMKSLRELYLFYCGLGTVPAFVGGLESLESLLLLDEDDVAFQAPLDFLIEGCPRLRFVMIKKGINAPPWTPESLTHLEAFKAKLRAKNPEAKVIRLPYESESDNE